MACPTNDRRVYVIDGANFADFDGFIAEWNRVYFRDFGADWNGNLDSFNDCFHWGPAEYVVIWRAAGKSRRDLGHEAMAEWLRGNVLRCHPTNIDGVMRRLVAASRGQGPTLFDDLVGIIRDQPNVDLRLE